MWAKGCGVVEQVPVGSPCNALTWFRKLDWLDAEEMLCLARNKFPLSWSLLMVCVVESVIFAIVPPAIPPGEARLGPWQLHRAYLPCSPCLSVCIQTWVPGMWAQAEWLNDLAVYIMWPRPELFCCTPQSVAIALLAIHLLGARPTSPCGSHLLPAQGSCFQLDSELKKRGFDLPHKCQRLSAVFADVQNYRTAFLGEPWLSGIKEMCCSPYCKRCSSSPGFLPRRKFPCTASGQEGRIWSLLCIK